MVPDGINKTYINKTFDVSIPARADWKLEQSPAELNALVFYTDGSKTPQLIGCRIYGIGGLVRRTSVSLDLHTTVFQAEIYAVLNCTQKLLDRKYYFGRRIFLTNY